MSAAQNLMNVSSVATSTWVTRRDVNSAGEKVVVRFETSTGKITTQAAEVGVRRRSWREEERSKNATPTPKMVQAPLLAVVVTGKRLKPGQFSSVLVLQKMKTTTGDRSVEFPRHFLR